MKNIKMNKQIIFIVIAVLILASVFFYFFTFKLRPKMDFGGVPLGWSKIQDLRPKKNVWGIQYQGTGTLEDALTTFKTEMEKAGWVHVIDENYSSLLKKDNFEAVIFASRVEPNTITVVILAAEAREQPSVGKPEIPTKDIDGEDITDVPRYPGSVRIWYESLFQDISIEYLTSENVSTVADFYTTQLPANGWRLKGMTTEEQKTEITATKTKRGLLTISIETSKDYEGYTNVEVVLTSLEI